MGALSKYAQGNAGTTGLAACRALYASAILAYLGGVAYPRWKNYRKAEKKKKEAEKLLKGGSKEMKSFQEEENKSIKRPGPAVNKTFFNQLRKLLKVN